MIVQRVRGKYRRTIIRQMSGISVFISFFFFFATVFSAINLGRSTLVAKRMFVFILFFFFNYFLLFCVCPW